MENYRDEVNWEDAAGAAREVAAGVLPVGKCAPHTVECRDCANKVPCWAADEARKIEKAAAEAARERAEVGARVAAAAEAWEREELARDKEHARLRALSGCPFRAGLREWPRDRCPETAGPDGCALWVDRGGWARGCAFFVLGVAVARGLDISAQVLPE